MGSRPILVGFRGKKTNSNIMLKFLGKGKDISGQRFGRLVAIEPVAERKYSQVVWRCRCDCGNKCFVASDNLSKGNTQSCGCLWREIAKIHGKWATPIYSIWVAMIQRCENPKSTAYKWYGARGISVCERWHSFENFYADVGDPPEGMSLDRYPNMDGNYEPSNFRWATKKEQANNSRPKSSGHCKQRWFRAWHEDSMCQYLSNNQNKFARKYGLCRSSISLCLRSKRKTTKGWTFKWIEPKKEEK